VRRVAAVRAPRDLIARHDAQPLLHRARHT
jgi:hypothetical protein